MKLLLCLAVLGFAAAELEHFSMPEETEWMDNPEEGEFFEGDMLLDHNPFTRNMKKSSSYKWPGAKVYYEIVNSGFSTRDLDMIQKGINEYHTKTCIRFVKRTTQDYWVRISRSSAGCFATVGKTSRNNSPQRINLGNGCTTRLGTVVHEMAHMLGFHHEQSRPDRDNYVTIMTQNIQSGKSGNFRKYTTSQVTTLGLPYDYGSVMHYGGYSFSSNRQPTIVPKQSGATIGQRNGFSSIDVQKLNAYYCNGQTGGTTKGTSGTTARPTSPPTSTSFSCNFNSGTCGFTQSRNDNFDWTRLTGPTGSANTGPSSGTYMYVEASSKPAGQKAEMISPGVSVSAGKYAIRFKYHMYGSTMGSLQAYFLYGSQKQTFFTKQGDQGNAWKSACLTLTVNGAGSLRLGFIGVVGSSYRSDMAVDDVSIARGECSGAVVTTMKPGTSGTGKTLLSCNFQSGTCGLSVQASTSFAWARKAGPTPSASTGPTTDSTGSATGYYIYTEASSSSTGAKTQLNTPYYTLDGGVGCLEFSFHMYGAAMGSLKVSYQSQGSSTVRTIYSKTGDQGNRWLRSRINLSGANTATRFVFEGTRGSSYTSDIALDNIVLRNQKC